MMRHCQEVKGGLQLKLSPERQNEYSRKKGGEVCSRRGSVFHSECKGPEVESGMECEDAERMIAVSP